MPEPNKIKAPITGCQCSGTQFCCVHSVDDGWNYGGPAELAPVVYLVERTVNDGSVKELAVCTRCYLDGRDKIVALLIDDDTDAQILFAYDSLGAFTIPIKRLRMN